MNFHSCSVKDLEIDSMRHSSTVIEMHSWMDSLMAIVTVIMRPKD